MSVCVKVAIWGILTCFLHSIKLQGKEKSYKRRKVEVLVNTLK